METPFVTKQILLNSWDIGVGSNTNFTQALQMPIQNVRAVHFLAFNMPNFIRPFTLIDNTFNFYQDGNTSVAKQVVIDVTRYFYTIADFVTYINGLFTASSDPRVQQLSFTQDNARMRLILNDAGGTVAPVGFVQGNLSLEGNYRIGFAKSSYAFSNSIVADGFPNVIFRTGNIRVLTNMTGTTHSAGNDWNTLWVVPVDVAPGNYIVNQNTYKVAFPSILPNVASINVALVDDDGVELNLPSNVYCNLQLAVECDP